jgi:hypothetical protein
MFGHHDVTRQREAPAIAHLVLNLDENIPGANRAQQWQARVTTEGDEMEMAASIMADQLFAHGMEEKSKPRPFQTKGSGTLKSQTGSSALTYWSGIIQLWAFVNRKNAKGWATRLDSLPAQKVRIRIANLDSSLDWATKESSDRMSGEIVMQHSSSTYERRDTVTQVLGWINLTLATMGLVQLLMNIVGVRILGDGFIAEYGGGVRNFYHGLAVMSVATFILLVPLGLLGILLVRGNARAPTLSKVFFIVETASFVWILWTWNMPFSHVLLSTIIFGLMNAGVGLQIVTAYPLIALILLTWRPRQHQTTPGGLPGRRVRE